MIANGLAETADSTGVSMLSWEVAPPFNSLTLSAVTAGVAERRAPAALTPTLVSVSVWTFHS